jgi:hypothetical protein
MQGCEQVVYAVAIVLFAADLGFCTWSVFDTSRACLMLKAHR